jgi:hypothetical protein
MLPQRARLQGGRSDIDCEFRYYLELMARLDVPNLIHEVLYTIARENNGEFENELLDFLFFMDANTNAKYGLKHSILDSNSNRAADMVIPAVNGQVRPNVRGQTER